jgi:hypothetical protein
MGKVHVSFSFALPWRWPSQWVLLFVPAHLQGSNSSNDALFENEVSGSSTVICRWGRTAFVAAKGASVAAETLSWQPGGSSGSSFRPRYVNRDDLLDIGQENRQLTTGHSSRRLLIWTRVIRRQLLSLCF